MITRLGYIYSYGVMLYCIHEKKLDILSVNNELSAMHTYLQQITRDRDIA